MRVNRVYHWWFAALGPVARLASASAERGQSHDLLLDRSLWDWAAPAYTS